MYEWYLQFGSYDADGKMSPALTITKAKAVNDMSAMSIAERDERIGNAIDTLATMT